MKHLIVLLSAFVIFSGSLSAQEKQEPWKNSQLLAPKVLADKITKNQTADVLILCVGPDAVIKGSVDLGAAHDAENLVKLKDYLKDVPKDKEVVIYCGCCPFAKCPNVRPAFTVLNEMGFRNARLLDLPKNIKVDWLDKNYPSND
ncbi:rhodanese-like domain-containing protein [Chitinophaga silvatica]|uniref:Rhodanese-like domain-containing protein n=1 Tax=Chitinophaga silvatica TaxID=2282649 RepID=A0A3E1Y9N8_9BACT|nr:rhodanese-like domain-containing protein [Chitinophaga silvatica]RFS21906.1 rhodanese-like domain-containing protein [Chitinophaga silvatica]